MQKTQAPCSVCRMHCTHQNSSDAARGFSKIEKQDTRPRTHAHFLLSTLDIFLRTCCCIGHVAPKLLLVNRIKVFFLCQSGACRGRQLFCREPVWKLRVVFVSFALAVHVLSAQCCESEVHLTLGAQEFSQTQNGADMNSTKVLSSNRKHWLLLLPVLKVMTNVPIRMKLVCQRSCFLTVLKYALFVTVAATEVSTATTHVSVVAVVAAVTSLLLLLLLLLLAQQLLPR